MHLFKDFVKKYGIGLILGSVTLDGYRKHVLNNKQNKILDQIKNEINSLSEERKALFDKAIEEENNKAKNKATILEFSEAADDYKKSADKFQSDPNDYNRNEMEKASKKVDKLNDDIRKLDISETITSLYNKYNEFLDSLTPDKIACLFNIIIDGLLFSSFFSVLSIMLSENIISKISFLEKYPKILNLLKLRNNINKKVAKFYLLMHFFIIIFGILGNI